MFAPIRLVEGGWPGPVERLLRRFVWADPRVVSTETTPERFRLAMKAFHLGAPTRSPAPTGTRRPTTSSSTVSTPLAPTRRRRRLGRFDLGRPRGTARRLLQLHDRRPLSRGLPRSRRRPHGVLRPRGAPRARRNRFLAWPEMSPLVARLYSRTIRRAAASEGRATIPLLNPTVRRLMLSDQRIRARTHDVFTVWPEPVDWSRSPTSCAGLLQRRPAARGARLDPCVAGRRRAPAAGRQPADRRDRRTRRPLPQGGLGLRDRRPDVPRPGDRRPRRRVDSTA